jgi:nucleoside-diphosphate-sugar epimerase
MRVLVAGSTGVIGRQLVPMLREAGHDVTALASRPRGPGVVVANGLDRAAVTRAVREAAPDAVVHLMTAIPQRLDPRKFGEQFALTNRLRTEGTRNLIEAAGSARVIAQGVAFAYVPGDRLADEDTPLWTDAPMPFRPVVGALADLERQTGDAGGLVLRFGHLYGPGTAYAPGGSFHTEVGRGRLPIVGKGTGVFSFTHTRDAATAIVAALDRPATGALNIVDDDPAPVAEWLPAYASALGARRPWRLPEWVGRLAAGDFGVAFFNRLRGADNARARSLLGWRPDHRSWREGLPNQE